MYAVVFHAHQKIDRTAYRHLKQVCGGNLSFFPRLRQVLHFEGRNGPDATKLKNKVDTEQPWHFVDPFDVSDTELIAQIEHHYSELVAALKAHNDVRAAFEAAWLAHALVDGLTPAHHYPYEQELEQLRGDSRHSRKGLLGRAFVQGGSLAQSVNRSFKLIGPRGLLTTHALFEAGAYSIMQPLRLNKAVPTKEDVQLLHTIGLQEYFQRMAREIAALTMYERFYKTGWTSKLSRDIRRELAPRMVKTVTLAWYAAMHEAALVKEPA